MQAFYWIWLRSNSELKAGRRSTSEEVSGVVRKASVCGFDQDVFLLHIGLSCDYASARRNSPQVHFQVAHAAKAEDTTALLLWHF